MTQKFWLSLRILTVVALGSILTPNALASLTGCERWLDESPAGLTSADLLSAQRELNRDLRRQLKDHSLESAIEGYLVDFADELRHQIPNLILPGIDREAERRGWQNLVRLPIRGETHENQRRNQAHFFDAINDLLALMGPPSPAEASFYDWVQIHLNVIRAFQAPWLPLEYRGVPNSPIEAILAVQVADGVALYLARDVPAFERLRRLMAEPPYLDHHTPTDITSRDSLAATLNRIRDADAENDPALPLRVREVLSRILHHADADDWDLVTEGLLEVDGYLILADLFRRTEGLRPVALPAWLG